MRLFVDALEQSENDLRFAFELEWASSRPVRGAAVAIKIRRDDPISLRQPLGERAPLGGGAAGTVQQHHRLAAAELEVFDALARDLERRHRRASHSDPAG